VQKVHKTLILFNGIALLISALIFGPYGFASFAMLALPGVLFITIGVSIGDKLKGRVYIGGIVAFLIWIIFEVLFIVWMATHSI
jgi:hypothetical protein